MHIHKAANFSGWVCKRILQIKSYQHREVKLEKESNNHEHFQSFLMVGEVSLGWLIYANNFKSCYCDAITNAIVIPAVVIT